MKIKRASGAKGYIVTTVTGKPIGTLRTVSALAYSPWWLFIEGAKPKRFARFAEAKRYIHSI